MFEKIQETVALLNQEYTQSFQVSKEIRAEDLRKICQFLEDSVKSSKRFLYTGEGNGKAGTRGIWSNFSVIWNVRPPMTGI